MINKEYEYSLKVKDWTSYINFCEKNGYILVEDAQQTRTLYENGSGLLARITMHTVDGKTVKKLDFKQDFLTGIKAVEKTESLALEFEDEAAVLSILEVLGYKKRITLLRNRKTYQKGAVKFELDEYRDPEQYYVVAVEGEKAATDKVFKEILKL